METLFNRTLALAGFHRGNQRCYIKWCRFNNFIKRDGANKVNMVENDEIKELDVMISNIQIRMIIELNMATIIVRTSNW